MFSSILENVPAFWVVLQLNLFVYCTGLSVQFQLLAWHEVC